MVHYKPVKVPINTPGLVDVIIDMVMQYYSLLDSIIIDQGAIFTSKFWFLLCYYFSIKRQLSTMFHPQIDRQTKQQNSTIGACLCAFVNWEQNDWARPLPMAEFAYNNSKNASTGHTPFEFNYGYPLYVSFEDKCNTCSRSFSAKELAIELKNLMNICCQNLLHAQDL